MHSDTAILLGTVRYRAHDYLQRLADALPDVDVLCGKTVFSRVAPQLRHIILGAQLDALRRHADTVDDDC